MVAYQYLQDVRDYGEATDTVSWLAKQDGSLGGRILRATSAKPGIRVQGMAGH